MLHLIKERDEWRETAHKRDIEISILKERVEELERSIKHWLCTECKTVYPGPPSDGFDCVICPKCGGSCGPLHVMERLAAEKERDSLKAQLDEAINAYDSCAVERDDLKFQLERAKQFAYRVGEEYYDFTFDIHAGGRFEDDWRRDVEGKVKRTV